MSFHKPNCICVDPWNCPNVYDGNVVPFGDVQDDEIEDLTQDFEHFEVVKEVDMEFDANSNDHEMSSLPQHRQEILSSDEDDEEMLQIPRRRRVIITDDEDDEEKKVHNVVIISSDDDDEEEKKKVCRRLFTNHKEFMRGDKGVGVPESEVIMLEEDVVDVAIEDKDVPFDGKDDVE